MDNEDQSDFSNEEIEDIVGQLTDEDLRQRSQALHDTQELYEELAYIANPKIPCRECGGSGQVHGGSFGDICVACMGARVMDAPGAAPFKMPPFAQLRAAITEYGNALADRGLPAGHRGKRNLALPAASSVPTLEQIENLRTEANDKIKQLAGSTPGVIDPRMLKAPKAARGLAGEGDLGEYEDAELADMEDEAHGND